MICGFLKPTDLCILPRIESNAIAQIICALNRTLSSCTNYMTRAVGIDMLLFSVFFQKWCRYILIWWESSKAEIWHSNSLIWIFSLLIDISLKFVSHCLIDDMLSLFQIMAWRHIGHKPLSQSMITSPLSSYARASALRGNIWCFVWVLTALREIFAQTIHEGWLYTVMIVSLVRWVCVAPDQKDPYFSTTATSPWLHQ